MTSNAAKVSYIRDAQGKEIYPTVNGEQVFLNTSTGPFYATDANGNEYYPQDKDGNDKAIVEQGIVKFAQSSEGEQLYPKNADGSDQFQGSFAKRVDDTIKYPLDAYGRPVYYTDPKTGDEIYHIDLYGSVVIARDADDNQVYAKRANGDEFFAGVDIYATDKNGLPVYPVTKDGRVIFPVTASGDEYYLSDGHGNDFYHSGSKELSRYAKNRFGDELYPTEAFKEIILRHRYAKNRNGEPFYPIDSYGNEFIIDGNPFDETKSLSASYPITNDDFLIVPKVQGKPYFMKNDPHAVTNANILGYLLRDGIGFHDYLSNVESLQRRSRATMKMYKYLPLGPAAKEVVRNAYRDGKAAAPLVPNVSLPPNVTKTSIPSWVYILLAVLLILVNVIVFVLLKRK